MVTIIKQDHRGKEALRYGGEIVTQDENSMCIRAPFTFATRDLGYLLLKQGDIFTEWFYRDRWYNVFQIHDGETGVMKGYYCNLTRPAHLSTDEIIWEDLALDVWVYPYGKTQLLDEDEYAALLLSATERREVSKAIEQIYQLVQTQQFPFIEIIAQG